MEASLEFVDDPWIPESNSKRPIFRGPTANVSRVDELLQPDLSGWDMEKLEENFFEPDISMIARIPVGRVQEDFWAWHPDRLGNFTVRSAYKLSVQLRRNDETPASSGGQDKKFWRKLWSLPVPPKVRNFWWRVIKGFVPARAVLCQRHIEQIGFCQACRQ